MVSGAVTMGDDINIRVRSAPELYVAGKIGESQIVLVPDTVMICGTKNRDPREIELHSW